MIQTLLKYFVLRNDNLRQQSYQNYHETIEKIAGRGNVPPSLDVQIASIYELRFYEQYYDLTLRLLDSYKKQFEKRSTVLCEIDELKKYIKNYKKQNSNKLKIFFKKYILPLFIFLIFYAFMILIPKLISLIFL